MGVAKPFFPMHSFEDSGIHFQETFGRCCLLIAQVQLVAILKPGWEEWYGHEPHFIPAVGIVVGVIVVSVVKTVPVVFLLL